MAENPPITSNRKVHLHVQMMFVLHDHIYTIIFKMIRVSTAAKCAVKLVKKCLTLSEFLNSGKCNLFKLTIFL